MIEKIKRTLGFILTHKLAAKNKTRAAKEFLKWQIQTFFSKNKTFKKNFAENLTVLVNKGQTGMTGNLYTGLHEFEDMGFLLHFLRPEDIFSDAGANVGSYTLLASGIVGAYTIAFEPIVSTFQNLDNNIQVNNLSNLVKLHNIGLSSEKGILKFSSLNDTTNHVLQGDLEADTTDVEVNTLDSVLKDNCPSLIKIDVEGFETEVLKGASLLLSNEVLKSIIIELNGSGERYGYSDLDIHNQLIDHNFFPISYDPFTRKLTRKEIYGDTNTIYIRDEEFVRARINTSKSYKIFGVSI